MVRGGRSRVALGWLRPHLRGLSRPGLVAAVLAVAVTAMAVNPLTTTRADAAVVTIAASEDATILSTSPDTNFGSDATVGTDNSPATWFLMRFDLSPVAGQGLTSARLRVFCLNASVKGGDLRAVSSPWSESSVTWNTPLTFASTITSSLGTVARGQWYEFDVGSLVASGGSLDVIVTSTSTDGADYASSEAPSGNVPQLVVTTDGGGGSPTPTPTPTPAPGSVTTATIPAIEDATLDSSAPSTNFGNAVTLGTDNAPAKRFLMRFDLSPVAGRTVTSAKLRLFDTNPSSKGGDLQLVMSSWSESTVTWNTPVSVAPGVIGSLGSVAAGNSYELDVTTALAGRTQLDAIVSSTSSNGADYASSEATSGNGPRLVVAYASDGAPRITISSPADHADVTVDRPVTFQGSATDEDGNLTSGLAWTSSEDGPIGTGGSPTFTFTDLGERTVTASVTDSDGRTGSATVTLTVVENQAPKVTISSPADGADVDRNSTVTFTGSATDEDGSLTNGLTWTSDVDGVIGTKGSFTHTFTTTGQRSITASVRDSRNVLGSKSITIRVVAPSAVTFDVGLVGDTGYTPSQVTTFRNFRDSTLNRAGLAFVTHDGDIKNGDDNCPDSVYSTWKDIFNGFTSPLIYTPGDNEWKDCPDRDPKERLDHIRQTFFSTNQSLGQTKLTVTRQAGYPENARWVYGNVVFATVNTPGSNNNSGDKPEFTARNAANLQWMREAFAAGQNARGVVIVTQANWGAPYNSGSPKSAFADSVALLEELTVELGKPVVLVHGDTHTFRIDHPMTHNGQTVSNFTRVETYSPSSGGSHWVRLRIVADSRVFVAASQ